MATNYNLTLRNFNGVDYDTLYPATTVEQIIGSWPASRLTGTIDISTGTSGELSAERLDGTIPVANGGTGLTSVVQNNVLIGDDSGGITTMSPNNLVALLGVGFETSIVTLVASGWSSYTQTVTVEGIVSNEASQLIIPIPALNAQNAYLENGVRVTAQGMNSLTFTCDSVPGTNLMVYIAWTGV